MAKAATLPFSKFLVQIGDGASPETFAAPCGLTSRGLNRSAETNDTVVPDCDDEDAPAWVERDIVSLSGEISGSGVLDLESLDVWDDWFESGAARNCIVKIDVPLAQNGRTYEGSFILSAFSITGERGSRAQVEVTLVSNGEVLKVDAAA